MFGSKSRDERERLKDIKEAMAAIRDHLTGVGDEQQETGAAETREAAPEIPWTEIASLRDLIPHE